MKEFRIQYSEKLNDYITVGVRRGYSVFQLKCSFCLKDFLFEFKLKRSTKIPCKYCKKKAFQLIYQNKNKIILRRYFGKGCKKKFDDLELTRKSIDRSDNNAKRQHEQPKMYLKNFCVKGSERIWVYNKKNATEQPRNIENFSKSYFLYDQARPQTIENMLWSIEDEMAPYLSRIIESNKLFQSKDSVEARQDKKVLIIRFIISMYLRRKMLKRLIFNKYKDLQFKNGNEINMFGIEFNGVYSRQDEEGRKIYNDLIQETHRNMIRASIGQETLYSNYKIHLLINKTSTPFVTSDNPIIRRKAIKYRKTIIPSRICFPISPVHCLFLVHPKEKCESSEIVLKEAEINEMNQWQYTYSNKYIISNHQNIEELIKKYNTTINEDPDLPLCLFQFVSNTSKRKYNFFL